MIKSIFCIADMQVIAESGTGGRRGCRRRRNEERTSKSFKTKITVLEDAEERRREVAEKGEPRSAGGERLANEKAVVDVT